MSEIPGGMTEREVRLFELGRKTGAKETREQILEALGIYDLVAKAIEEHGDSQHGD